MKTMKRFLSCLLIVSMIMSFMSVSAFADEIGDVPNADVPNEPVQKQWPLLEGEKTAAVLGSERTDYKVTVQVPGGEGVEKHDAVILMVDGSYSMDSEWDQMKEAILMIGDTVLNGSGTTKMSMMAFGMSPNVVLENVKSVEELAAELPALPGGLLYGRSSTNCHAAFLGLREYVAELRAKEGDALNNVYVLFMSDGQVNQHALQVDWNTYAMNISKGMASGAHTCEMDYICAGMAEPSEEAITAFGEELKLAQDYFNASVEGLTAFYEAGGTYSEFSSLASTIATLTSQKAAKEAAIEAAPGLIAAAEAELADLLATAPEEDPETNEAVIAKRAELADLQDKAAAYPAELEKINAKLNGLIAYRDNTSAYETIQNSPSEAECLSKAQYYVNLVWKNFYEETDFDPAVQYPVHVMETGFLQYQESLGNYHIEDCFYYAAMGGAPIGNKNDLSAREEAAKAAASLAAEVDGLDMIRYYPHTDRNKWMESIEGATFTQSSGISSLTAALGEVLKSLEQTPYNDVVVTDYMSKWVNLKPETIKVLDRDGNVVAAFDEANSDAANGVYNYKWVGTPLCAAKAPIVLEKVAAEDYAAGGENVIGNTNGDIYKITWNIKDGALYRADNYKMQYEVTVDEQEYGFQYNTSYPANGDTDLEYLDENNESKTNVIDVPNVDVPKDTPNIIPPPVQEEDPDPTPTEPAEQPKEEPAEPEEVIEVEEEEPPLADIEEPDVPLADIEEIEEEEVPLTDVPKTGDSSNMMLWMMMALLSAAALAGIRIAERKER